MINPGSIAGQIPLDPGDAFIRKIQDLERYNRELLPSLMQIFGPQIASLTTAQATITAQQATLTTTVADLTTQQAFLSSLSTSFISFSDLNFTSAASGVTTTTNIGTGQTVVIPPRCHALVTISATVRAGMNTATGGSASDAVSSLLTMSSSAHSGIYIGSWNSSAQLLETIPVTGSRVDTSVVIERTIDLPNMTSGGYTGSTTTTLQLAGRGYHSGPATSADHGFVTPSMLVQIVANNF
jgi:hypothetical protein